MLSLCLDVYPGAELLDHGIALRFAFGEPDGVLFRVAIPFILPPTLFKGYIFSILCVCLIKAASATEQIQGGISCC